jgi:hypothetical protein
VSTRSKFFQLEEAEGGYIAGCSLCYWVDSFTSKRTARSQYLDHDCRAACVGMNIDIFYEPDTINDAIVVCNTCPVRSSCLFDAMREERSHLAWGVRGGLTPEERMALKVTSRG